MKFFEGIKILAGFLLIQSGVSINANPKELFTPGKEYSYTFTVTSNLKLTLDNGTANITSKSIVGDFQTIPWIDEKEGPLMRFKFSNLKQLEFESNNTSEKHLGNYEPFILKFGANHSHKTLPYVDNFQHDFGALLAMVVTNNTNYMPEILMKCKTSTLLNNKHEWKCPSGNFYVKRYYDWNGQSYFSISSHMFTTNGDARKFPSLKDEIVQEFTWDLDLKFKTVKDLSLDELEINFKNNIKQSSENASKSKSGKECVSKDEIIAKLKEIKKSNEPKTNDSYKFHKNGPICLDSVISCFHGSSGESQLFSIYEELKQQEKHGELQIFLDSLASSGTESAFMVIKVVTLKEISKGQLSFGLYKVLATFPTYLKNPRKIVLSEFEEIFNQSKNLPTWQKQQIELTFAALFRTVCQKDRDGCENFPMLQKWMDYWWTKFEGALSFASKTEALLLLRNFHQLSTARKILQVALNKDENVSVRSTAISCLYPLFESEPNITNIPQYREKIFKGIFEEKDEDLELRKSAATLLLFTTNDGNVYKRVGVVLENETDKMLINFAKTILKLKMKYEVSSGQKPATKLMEENQSLKNWKIDKRLSGVYGMNLDSTFGFDLMSSVLKTGKSFMPRTIDVALKSLSNSDFATNVFTVFLRIEGLEKIMTSRLMSLTTGVIEFDDIENIFEQIGVKARTNDPFKFEISFGVFDRTIFYYGIDETGFFNAIPKIIDAMKFLKSSTNVSKEFDSSFLFSRVAYEFRNFGTSLSVSNTLSALTNLKLQTEFKNLDGGLTVSKKNKLDFNIIFQQVSFLSTTQELTDEGSSLKSFRTFQLNIPLQWEKVTSNRGKTFKLILTLPENENPFVFKFKQNNYLFSWNKNQTGVVKEIYSNKTLEGFEIIEDLQYKQIRDILEWFGVSKLIEVSKFLEAIFQNWNHNYRKANTKMSFTFPQNSSLKMLKTVEFKVEDDNDTIDTLDFKVSTTLNFEDKNSTKFAETLDISVSMLEFTGKVMFQDHLTCFNISSMQASSPDLFGYEGKSEPKYELGINVTVFKKAINTTFSCTYNQTNEKQGEIILIHSAFRSKAQRDEANKIHEDGYYAKCKEQKSSPKYPGPLTPATDACLQVLYKQTNLLESNLNVDYKWKENEGKLKANILLDEGQERTTLVWDNGTVEIKNSFEINRLKFPLPFTYPVQSRFPELVYIALNTGVFGYCDVTSYSVQTFDNFTYHPELLEESYTLISGDCSETPRFVILGKKLEDNRLGLKIVAGHHKVILENTQHFVMDDTNNTFTDEINYPYDDILIKLFKHDAQNVFLLSRHLSIVVRYTGYYATIVIDSRYRTKQCGLCGNFDGRRDNEFVGAAGEYFDKNEKAALINSYALKGE